MKILSVNCRSLKGAAAVRALREIQEQNNPEVMFLTETHLDKEGGERLRMQTKIDVVIVADSDGKSGGLVMLWKSEIDIVEMAVHPNYIDVLVNGGDEAKKVEDHRYIRRTILGK
jgi:exonuclease III